jgi:hypothetical protein
MYVSSNVLILTCPDDGGLAKDEGGGGDGDHSSARSQQHQSYNKPEILYNTRLLTYDQRSCITIDC